ncbi:MAG: hypothetical protein ACYCW6_20225, partial [Candidatus Xenobia bacterium]
DEQVVRVLALGALLGRPFSADDVAALDAELAAPQVAALLQDAPQVRLEHELYRFVSEGASQSFLATLPPQEQRRLHARVAALEESRSPGESRSVARAARIAYHWRAAGEPERATAALAQIDAAAEGEGPNLPPLSVDQVARTLATLRSMRLAVHDLRNGAATAVSERIHIAMEELSILLAEVRTVSLAPAAAGVLLNGRQVPYPSGAGRRLLEEFNLDLTQAGITSMTLHVGLTGDELRAALGLMAGTAPADWESALLAAAVRHVQVNKRLETVRASRATVRRLLGVEGDALEGQETIRNTLLYLLERTDAVHARRVEGHDADRLTSLLNDSRAMLEEAIDLVRLD